MHDINIVKGQPAEWEEIVVNHMSDERMISRICRDHLKLKNKSTISSNMGKDLDKDFAKEDI